MKLRWATLMLVAGIASAVVLGYFVRESSEDSFLRAMPDRLIALILFGVPFVSFFNSALVHGNEGSVNLKDGMKGCRLKKGARWLVIFFGVLMMAAAVAAAIEAVWSDSEQNGLGWDMAFLCASSFIFGSYTIFAGKTANVSWNSTIISATSYRLARKQHDWSDLMCVVETERMEIDADLVFRSTGKAKISKYYEAYDEIISTARRMLKRNMQQRLQEQSEQPTQHSGTSQDDLKSRLEIAVVVGAIGLLFLWFGASKVPIKDFGSGAAAALYIFIAVACGAYAISWLRRKIHWGGNGVKTPNIWGFASHYSWSVLSAIEFDEDGYYDLIFSNEGPVRVSPFSNGGSALIQVAKGRLTDA